MPDTKAANDAPNEYQKRKQTDDYDTPWKETVEYFFPAFILFFFGWLYDMIDWKRGFEFKDKELQQVTRDAATGRHYVDKLVKVWLLNGQEVWILIHIEVQGQYDKDFSYRMYVEHHRLYERYKHEVASLAVLSDENNWWRPNTYHKVGIGTELSFSFSIAKVLDYMERWEELKADTNPFATVVMAHLETQATREKPHARKQAKSELAHRLYELGSYDEKEMRALLSFLDWMMRLPNELEEEYWQDIQSYERSYRMPYVMSIERISEERGMQRGIEIGEERGIQIGKEEGIQIGEERGIQIGEERGKVEGMVEGIALVLELKFGEEGLSLLPEIRQLHDLSLLKGLYDALRTARTLDDVRQVYASHIHTNAE